MKCVMFLWLASAWNINYVNKKKNLSVVSPRSGLEAARVIAEMLGTKPPQRKRILNKQTNNLKNVEWLRIRQQRRKRKHGSPAPPIFSHFVLDELWVTLASYCANYLVLACDKNRTKQNNPQHYQGTEECQSHALLCQPALFKLKENGRIQDSSCQISTALRLE